MYNIIQDKVNIIFKNTKIEKIFNSKKLLQKEYGEQAKKIMIRMAVLKSAPNLAAVPVTKPDRRHELSGKKKGSFAVDLKHPFRRVFEPMEDPVPNKEDRGIDMEKITAIKILTVEDYH